MIPSWSSVDLAGQCLFDSVRTAALAAALRETVQQGDVVLDIGAGSGVLSLVAVECGAKSVIAVENDPVAYHYLCRNVRKCAEITPILGDASDVDLDLVESKFDCVIAEIIDTWLIHEDFIKALSAIGRRGVLTQTARVIPYQYRFAMGFGSLQPHASHRGIQWPTYLWPFYAQSSGWNMPQFEQHGATTTVFSLRTNDLLSQRQQGICISCELDLPDSSVGPTSPINAVILSGTVYLSQSVELDASNALNAPLVIPLDGVQGIPHPKVCVELVFDQGSASLSVVAGGVNLLHLHRGVGVGALCKSSQQACGESPTAGRDHT